MIQDLIAVHKSRMMINWMKDHYQRHYNLYRYILVINIFWGLTTKFIIYGLQFLHASVCLVNFFHKSFVWPNFGLCLYRWLVILHTVSSRVLVCIFHSMSYSIALFRCLLHFFNKHYKVQTTHGSMKCEKSRRNKKECFWM